MGEPDNTLTRAGFEDKALRLDAYEDGAAWRRCVRCLRASDGRTLKKTLVILCSDDQAAAVEVSSHKIRGSTHDDNSRAT